MAPVGGMYLQGLPTARKGLLYRQLRPQKQETAGQQKLSKSQNWKPYRRTSRTESPCRYPDVQTFMRTFRQMEAVVEQYHHGLAQWERQTGKTGSPPEKESVREKLRQVQQQGKQKPPCTVKHYTRRIT